MSHELAAAAFGIGVGAVTVAANRLFGDEVYQSKSAVTKASAVVAVVAAAAYYLTGGAPL